jgi:broad-specificity NMP kinase
MDRNYEELRTEVLELDRESQGKLVEEIEEQWTAEIDNEAFEEAARRMEAYRRGEVTTVSAEESTARVRRIIEDYKQSHK